MGLKKALARKGAVGSTARWAAKGGCSKLCVSQFQPFRYAPAPASLAEPNPELRRLKLPRVSPAQPRPRPKLVKI